VSFLLKLKSSIKEVLLLLCCFIFMSHDNLIRAQAEGAVRKVLDIEFAAINEQSGLAKSQTYDDVLWVHNDSGDVPRLFALDSQGKVIIPSFLERRFHGEEVEAGKEAYPGLTIELAANIDWEDIAITKGAIYIADMGNNGNARRDLGIYVINEPNPSAVSRTRPYQFIPVRYSDQSHYPPERWTFDSEALFVHDDAIYVLTKHRGEGFFQLAPGANLYRLTDWKSDQINVLEKVDSHADLFFITAADLSQNGEWLAVTGYTEVWLFPAPGVEGKWLSGQARRLSLDPAVSGIVEALTWMNDSTLLLGSEGGSWFSVDINDIPIYDGEPKWEEGRAQIRRRLPIYR